MLATFGYYRSQRVTISWNIRPEDAWGALAEQQINAIEADIVALIENMLDKVQQSMRSEARWQDVTGDARAGLYTDIEYVVRQSVVLLMSHGPTIPYAIYLEYAHAGRFAILGDTADRWWPVLYRDVGEIVRRHSS
jgi:hypothetical protein